MDNPKPYPLLDHGDMLSWYRIERVLGRGGFGVIYLATDTNLQHQVAIKEYRVREVADKSAKIPDAKPKPKGPVSPLGMQRFIEEARNLVRFKHPNIVRVMSVFELNDTAYIVMEFEEGIDFRQHLAIRSNATESALKSIIVPIANGLAQVHLTGFIHRDIKPTNILVRTDGSPVLLDFGSARDSTPDNTEPLTALVSVGYAPLEQYSGGSEREQGPWTDIYAMGAVLYFAVTGVDPVDSAKRASALLNGGQDPLIKARMLGQGKYSAAFLSAIDWALEFRISDRPESLSVWMTALLRLPSDDQETKHIGGNGVRGSNLKNDADKIFLQDHPVPNEVQVAQRRRATKGGKKWLSTAGVLLIGVGVTTASAFLLLGGKGTGTVGNNSDADVDASNVLRYSVTNSTGDDSTTDNSSSDNAALQNELNDANTRAENLAAELLREQEKIKATEIARKLAEDEKAVEREAERAAAVRAASAAEQARERATSRRVTQVLDTAANMLNSGRFNEAERALDTASNLDSDNARLAQLRARWRAVLELSRAPVTDSEFDGVVSRFDELRRAIQNKDLDKINRMTSASSQNELFAQLISKFGRLELSIDAIKLNNVEKSISAVLRIDRMVRDNGDASIPSSAYQERRLTSRRIGRQWSAIQW